MTHPPPTDVAAAHAVEAFESAIATGAATDLAHFAPAASDPDRGPVLAELIRVDLEYRWRAGEPTPLDDYRSRFPEAFTRSTLPDLAFEEYRLRRFAGESVQPAEYQVKYGIVASDWGLFPAGSLAVQYRHRPTPPNDATAVIVRPRSRTPAGGSTHQRPGGEGTTDLGDELPRAVQQSLVQVRASHPAVADEVLRLQRLFPKPGSEFSTTPCRTTPMPYESNSSLPAGRSSWMRMRTAISARSYWAKQVLIN